MKKLGQKWVNAIERSDSIADWIPFVCEIAAGSRMKYSLDKRSGQLALHRAMADGVRYPTNYGFIPRTLAMEDGMELDLMAISSEPLLPLIVARVRVIGGCTVRSTQDEEPEDKLLGAVVGDPDTERLTDLSDVDAKLRTKIEEFYTTYKQDEGLNVTVERWFDRVSAIEKLKAGFKAARGRKPK